jgi:hypothetical protein
MKPKFVTCNYTNLNGTKFNGRLNRDFVFLYSLTGIAQTGDPIVNYTCPYNMNFVDPFLAARNVTNVTSIDYDLATSPYHPLVDAIKDLKPMYYQVDSWRNRCVEIMWGKFLWLEDNFEKLDDDDYLFWIDAGLSHGGLIPRKFCTFHNDKRYYNPDNQEDMLLEYAHRHDKIFNPEFSKRLEAYAGDQILLICNQHTQHGDPLGFHFINNQKQWPIGGLFGGKKKMMVPFIQKFKELSYRILATDLLVKEEQIMTVIYNDHPGWFKTYTFDTWYHDDWIVYGVFDPNTMRSFSNFFLEIGVCI